MKLPSLAKFMDMKDPRDRLGPPKAGEINRDNLPTKEMFLVWEKQCLKTPRKFLIVVL